MLACLCYPLCVIDIVGVVSSYYCACMVLKRAVLCFALPLVHLCFSVLYAPPMNSLLNIDDDHPITPTHELYIYICLMLRSCNHLPYFAFAFVNRK